jgi:hypothetical protein
MAKNWRITSGDPSDKLLLGRAEIGETEPTEPVSIDFQNISGYIMGGVVVGAEGDGATLIQFARDEGGQPGAWAEAGQQVISGRVERDGSFRVWARIIPPEDGNIGMQDFDIVVKGMAVG